jgi:hypothetical protein
VFCNGAWEAGWGLYSGSSSTKLRFDDSVMLWMALVMPDERKDVASISISRGVSSLPPKTTLNLSGKHLPISTGGWASDTASMLQLMPTSAAMESEICQEFTSPRSLEHCLLIEISIFAFDSVTSNERQNFQGRVFLFAFLKMKIRRVVHSLVLVVVVAAISIEFRLWIFEEEEG